MTYFSGRVHSVVFSNPGDAFYILRMVLDEGAPSSPVASGTFGSLPGKANPWTTVKGYVPGLPINTGAWFGFEAKWVNNPKYGKQLSITKAPVLQGGWTPDAAERILVANGVGAGICSLVRKHFGDDRFLGALEDPNLLGDVSGVSQFAANHIAQRWESVKAYFLSLDFLAGLGLPNGKIRKVWATFSDNAVHILSKNPWALVQVDGITFEEADGVARHLGLDMESPDRAQGATLYACKGMRNFGHVYRKTGDLLGDARRLAGSLGTEDLASALSKCHKEGTLVLDRETKPGTTAVYEPWMYHMESQVADRLLQRQKTADLRIDPDSYLKALQSVGPNTEEHVKAGGSLDSTVETAVDEWGGQAKLNLASKQRQGVINALLHPISILTGLPGTGKTMSLKAVVHILQDSGVPFLLCAPTGVAAKNLAAVTGAKASTIHRAFSAKGGDESTRDSTYVGVVGEAGGGRGGTGEQGFWGYSQDQPYPAEVVLIDEVSMVDLHLLYRLLDCTSPQCRLVFVGDSAQLPSVGPGSVLWDLIKSAQFPVVKLTEIFRQKERSDIVHAAHAIHAGEVPKTSLPSDFVLGQLEYENDVLNAICRLAEKLYDKRVNFQILSPRHAGTVGVTNLNAHLRELLNPKGPGIRETQLGKDIIREGDRVMVVKNCYKRGVFNGDVGKISRIDLRAKEVEVKIFGDPPLLVRFLFREMPKFIRLAYAVTIHKAQGLEYDAIVMPIVEGFRHQLQRNLLYTAVTRAREKVYLLGSRAALSQAVSNDKEDMRDTLLVERLTK